MSITPRYAPFDDLDLLRVFVRIIESGSISSAARSLRSPQPTLSRQLRTLEERAGTALLLRDTHRMSLTEAGHRLLADARALLSLADEATDRLREERAELRGHLRVFATVDLGQSAVSRVLARFLLEHPGVTAELAYSNRPMQMIEAGHDAGVVVGDITDENVVARSIASLERVIVAAPQYVRAMPRSQSPDDLEAHRWLSLSQKQFGGTVISLLGPRGAQRTLAAAPSFVSEGVSSLLEAVREGLGLCVLPLWLIGGELGSGRLVRVLPQSTAPPLPLSIIHLAQRTLPARVRRFIDFAAPQMLAELGADAKVGAAAPPSPERRPRSRSPRT